MALGVDVTLWGEGRLARVDWRRVQQQLRLQLPACLPLPRGEAEVRVSLTASFSSSGTTFRLSFEVEAEHEPGAGFAGLAIDGRVRLGVWCELGSESEAGAALAAFESGATLHAVGRVTAAVPVRLPTLPDWEIARFRAPSGSGGPGLTLELEMGFESGAEPAVVTLAARVQGPCTAELFMPGAPTESGWLEARVDVMEGTLSVQAGRVTGELTISGGFRAELWKSWLVPPPLAPIEPLLGLLTARLPDHAQLSGDVYGELSFDARGPRLSLSCSPHDAELHLDLHELLGFVRDTVRGQPLPPPPPPRSDEPLPIRLPDIGVAVRRLSFELSAEPMAAFELEALIAGVAVPFFASIAHRRVGGLELGLGVGHPAGIARRQEAQAPPRIPLIVPPLHPEELRPIADLYRAALSGAGQGRYDTIIHAYFEAIERAIDLLSAGEPSLVAHPTATGWVVVPTDRAPVRSSRSPILFAMGRTVETPSELAIGYDAGEGWRPLLVKPAIEFDGLSLSCPLQNLRDVRVSGTVRFTCEGPFHDIRRLPVTLGLSLDMIYASVDTEGGVAIDVPGLLPGYDRGRIVIGQLRLGFGYTKRSLALSFAGELFLPQQLVDDLDTSDTLGAGVRLPLRSKLALRFDMIPVVVGKLVLPLPSLQFDWDLRRSLADASIRDRATCEPGWDGLQIIVPGVFRAGLERISFSPLLGGVVAYWNSDFGGDLQLGGDGDGLTCCLDNSMWAYAGDPSIWTLPLIPILSIPFFDDACLALRMGGFAFGFDLQRPLPTFSPLAIFEVMALVSDPLNYRVAPRGELADTLRVTLAHGRLTLPAPVRALFPGAPPLPLQAREITINLADYIRILQQLGGATAPVIARVLELARAGAVTAKQLREATAPLAGAALRDMARAIAEAVPPALRQFSFSADFAGFRGSASLGFAGWAEILEASRTPDTRPPPIDEVDASMEWDPRAMERFQPLARGDAPLSMAAAPQAAWFEQGLLAGVSPADLAEIPLPDPEPAYLASEVTDPVVDWIVAAADDLAKFIGAFVAPERAVDDRGRDRLPGRPRLPAAGSDGGPAEPPSKRAIAEALNRALGEAELLKALKVGELPGWLARRRDQATKPSELRAFRRLLLELARPRLFASDQGLVCTATLDAFFAEFQLLGWIRQSGEFALVTRGQVAAPWIRVAGMELGIPFTMAGRGVLQGSVGRAGVFGSLRLEGHAAGALLADALHVEIGNDKSPVVLELWGDGRFAMAGKGSVSMFGGAGLVAGDLSLTDRRMQARGELTVLGFVAAACEVSADASLVTVAAKLAAPARGRLPGATLDCALEGRVGGGHLSLAGAAKLDVPAYGLALAGSGRWDHDKDASTLTVEGDAVWQGIGSVRGRVTAGRDALTMTLGARVAHRLSELFDRLPGIRSVLGPLGDILVQLDLDATFHFSLTGELRVGLRGSWLVAVAAGASPHFHAVLAGRVGAELRADAPLALVDLRGLQQLPLPALPQLDMASAAQVKLSKSKVLGVDAVHLEWAGVVVPPHGLNPELVATLPDDFGLSVGPHGGAGMAGIGIPLGVELAMRGNRLALVFRYPAPSPGPHLEAVLALGA